MAQLDNFPIKDQRTTVLSDGTRDSNSDFDCVAECIAAGLQFFLGKNYEGGVIKEACYGRNYQGGTYAGAYVDYCAQQGVRLYSLQGAPADLITLAHTHIQQGHPVLITEVDPYVDTSLPQYQGWMHVVVFCSEGSGQLAAMDPFVAQILYKSDQGWQNVMAVNEIWIMEEFMIDLNTPGVSTFFKLAPNGWWQSIATGHTIHGEILKEYTTFGNSGLCGLTHWGLPTSEEINLNVPNHPEIVEQDFERLRVRYDPHHVLEFPPGAGEVYVIQQPAPDAKLQALKDQLAQADTQIAGYQQKLNQIEVIAKS